MTGYEQGFMAKCAEYGVSHDYAAYLLSVAQGGTLEKTAAGIFHLPPSARVLLKRYAMRPWQKATGQLSKKYYGAVSRYNDLIQKRITKNPAHMEQVWRQARIDKIRDRIRSRLASLDSRAGNLSSRLNYEVPSYNPRGTSGQADYAWDILAPSASERASVAKELANVNKSRDILDNRYWSLTRMRNAAEKAKNTVATGVYHDAQGDSVYNSLKRLSGKIDNGTGLPDPLSRIGSMN